MATVSLTIVGQNVGNYVFARELDDVDAGRIIQAYGAIYGPITETINDEQVTRALTPTEIVERISDGFLRGVLNNVKRKEDELARNAIDTPLIVPIEI